MPLFRRSISIVNAAENGFLRMGKGKKQGILNSQA
jgi:hypothetical protein